LMLAVAEWSFCYLFADLAPDPRIQIFWLAAAYVGITFAGPLWLLFALAITGRLELLPRRAYAGILVMGALGLATALANGALARWQVGPGFHGPLFWLHTLIAYSTILAGLAVCARAFVASPSPYREQAGLMLIGALAPLLVNIAVLAGLLDGAEVADLTPITMVIFGLVVSRAIRRYQLLTISPIARQVVLDSMADGLIVVDPAGRIVEHNPAATMLATLVLPATGRPLAEATHDRAIGAVLESMLASGAVRRERTIACQAADERRLQVALTPLADASGRRIGTLLMLRDVTRQARAEEALARRVADLTTLHQVASAVGTTIEPPKLLPAIVTAARDALGVTSATVGLIDEEHCALKITAESGAGPAGSVVGLSFPVRGSSFKEAWHIGAPIVIENPQSDERLALLHDLLVRRGTRSLLIVPLRVRDRLIGTLNLASATPHSFDQGELALAQTIAGYAAAAIANAQLFAASQQAVRAKSAILDTVSHEFRTPITAILGFTELYRESILGPVTDEQQEALEAIHRNAHRLLKLVDDLLDLARLEAGTLDMALAQVEIGLCIREATALLEPQLRQKGLGLHVEIAEGLPLAWADTMWLRRVLVNLLNNALRFTETGTITIRAYETSAGVGSGARLAIEVADTGLGIPEADQQLIFEAFRRVEEGREGFPSGSGTGLGLAISKLAIDQMDGQLRLQSRPGYGSTFTIALRAAEMAREHRR
ncbi:MAG TPA: histidine kinase N-terminal 7TM domain-containing protein, partial [Roseiflexaceae bacterium]